MGSNGGLWVTGDVITADRSNWKGNMSQDATPSSAFAGQVWSNTSYSPSTLTVYGSNSNWYPITVLRTGGDRIAAQSNTYAGMLAFCTNTASSYTAGQLYLRNNTNSSWVDVAPDRGNGHVTLMPDAYNTIDQGTWAWVTAGTAIFAFVWANSPNADADGFSFKSYLDAGTFTFLMVGGTYNDQGIMELLIDGVSKGTVDLYTSGLVYNVRKVITGISITTPGLKTIQIKTNGKNASSSAYVMRYSYFSLWRTA